MRVIDLDDTGVKIVNDKKNQMYLDNEEVSEFLKGNYILTDKDLTFKNQTLVLSKDEINNFPLILTILKRKKIN